MVLAGTNNTTFRDLISSGAENTSVLDYICAVLIALSPILQHYKGFYQNAGFSVMILMAPYLCIKLLIKLSTTGIRGSELLIAAPLVLFQIYRLLDHSISVGKLLYCIFLLVFFLSCAFGCINLRVVVHAAALVSCFAGILLFIQYLLFYGLHYHLQLVPTSLLLPESDIWILGAQTGLIGVTGQSNGFYRPSAFFLEPSHLFIYSFPILCLLLLSPDMKPSRLRMAILVTMGMVLSTSGMGIAIAIGLWALYFGLYSSEDNRLNTARIQNVFSFRTIFFVVLFLAVAVVAYLKVGFIRNAVTRIFSVSGDSNSTAIQGRTARASSLIDQLRGRSMLFGLTEDVSEIHFNLPGFYSTLYKYGIVGVVLSYLFYILALFRLKGSGFWLAALIILISFFTAHTHGTFYMMYFTLLMLSEFSTQSRKTGGIRIRL